MTCLLGGHRAAIVFESLPERTRQAAPAGAAGAAGALYSFHPVYASADEAPPGCICGKSLHRVIFVFTVCKSLVTWE